MAILNADPEDPDAIQPVLELDTQVKAWFGSVKRAPQGARRLQGLWLCSPV